MSTIEQVVLTDLEQAALSALMAGPLVSVHVRIAVKFRALQHDFGTMTAIDHLFQWPIPAVFASAFPHPVSLNTHGIQLDVTLAKPVSVPVSGTETGAGDTLPAAPADQPAAAGSTADSSTAPDAFDTDTPSAGGDVLNSSL